MVGAMISGQGWYSDHGTRSATPGLLGADGVYLTKKGISIFGLGPVRSVKGI